MSKQDFFLLLNSNIKKSVWIYGYCRVVKLRQKEVHKVIQWLDYAIQKDEYFNELSSK